MGDDKHERHDNIQQDLDRQGIFPDPRRTLDGVRSNMEEILGRIRWPMWWPWAPVDPSAEEPASDVVDVGGEFIVVIDLPGVAKEDIEINATRDSVEIAATKADKPTQQKANYIRRERGCASLKRVLALSEEIIPDKTEASFENGVLTIILEKRQAAPTRERVQVNIK